MVETVAVKNAESRLVSPGILFALAAFVISRILYWHAGVRFDSSPIGNYWQNIDPVLMKTRLLQSLFYLHMQPPGFSLALGVVLKTFPTSYAVALQVIYLILGLAITLCLMHLMRLFRVPEIVSAGLTTLFLISPGCVMYENLASYEYPILLLLLLAAIALYRFCQVPSVRRALMFFAILFALTMVRNIFHILFVLLIAAALATVMPRARKAVFWGVLPALLLILALQTKNWILFHSFTTSTWAGMNTGTTTTFQLTPDEADRLIRQGVLTPLARIRPFSSLKEYSAFIHPIPATGIPILDQAETSTGHPNFNNPLYLQLHQLYFANSKAVWLHYPQAYARAVAIAWFTYFLPATDYEAFDAKRSILQPFDRMYSEVVFGQFRQAPTRKDLRAIRASKGVLPLVPYTGIFAMIGLTVLMFWASRQLLSRQRPLGHPEHTVLGFMVVTILFCTTVSNFLATFENNRYRFPLDGYYTVIAALAITSVARKRRLIDPVVESPDAAPVRA